MPHPAPRPGSHRARQRIRLYHPCPSGPATRPECNGPRAAPAVQGPLIHTNRGRPMAARSRQPTQPPGTAMAPAAPRRHGACGFATKSRQLKRGEPRPTDTNRSAIPTVSAGAGRQNRETTTRRCCQQSSNASARTCRSLAPRFQISVTRRSPKRSPAGPPYAAGPTPATSVTAGRCCRHRQTGGRARSSGNCHPGSSARTAP